MNKWKTRLTRLAVTVGLVSTVGSAWAQDAFPSRPLKIVVPTSAGSGSDTTARHFGEQLSAVLGQPVTIENRPGGNGAIAAMAVKNAPADGYTIFLGTNTHMAVNPVAMKDVPYDAVKDFTPVTGLARGMMVFVVNGNSRFNTLGDLVKAASSGGKDLTVGSYTAGFQLSAAWFGSTSNTKHLYINYRGAPEVFVGLMGEQLDWAVSDLIASLPQVKAGKLKALAVSGEVRHPELPDEPTVKESGFPDYVNYTWTSMYIRSETPPAVTSKLVESMQRIMATAAARDFIRKIGSDPMALPPAEMRRFQLSETERFRRVMTNAGIQPQ
jgi:tripartite-type tricarboxylate transporter receptor subunit TctC